MLIAMIKKLRASFTKKFLKTKLFLYAITLFYIVLIMRYSYLANSKSDLSDYFKSLSDNLGYLGFVFTTIGLFWIYDTREALEVFSKKHTFIDVVQLIDLILQKNEPICDESLEDLITKVVLINPSELPTLSAIEKKDNENMLGTIGVSITLESLQRAIVSEYFVLKESVPTEKIKNCVEFTFFLRLMRSYIKDQIMRDSI